MSFPACIISGKINNLNSLLPGTHEQNLALRQSNSQKLWHESCQKKPIRTDEIAHAATERCRLLHRWIQMIGWVHCGADMWDNFVPLSQTAPVKGFFFFFSVSWARVEQVDKGSGRCDAPPTRLGFRSLYSRGIGRPNDIERLQTAQHARGDLYTIRVNHQSRMVQHIFFFRCGNGPNKLTVSGRMGNSSC